MTITATPEQQLTFLCRDLAPLLEAVVAGYDYNPGSSDLDDEQPIHISMTLGDYRRANRLRYEVGKSLTAPANPPDREGATPKA